MNRSLVRNTLRSAFFTCAILYIGFHSLHGEQGLYALMVQSHRKDVLEQELAKTKAERDRLEHRVSLLRPETLDKDLLDEQSRRYLGVMKPDEVVIYSR